MDRSVRQSLEEISEVIDHLERTCRAGRITPRELSEEKDLLRAQEYALRARN